MRAVLPAGQLLGRFWNPPPLLGAGADRTSTAEAENDTTTMAAAAIWRRSLFIGVRLALANRIRCVYRLKSRSVRPQASATLHEPFARDKRRKSDERPDSANVVAKTHSAGAVLRGCRMSRPR